MPGAYGDTQEEAGPQYRGATLPVSGFTHLDDYFFGAMVHAWQTGS